MSRIFKIKELAATLGLSRTTIWRMERAGTFPRRIRLGPNSVGWDADEIAAWVASRPRGFTNAQQSTELPHPRKAG